MSCGLIWHLPNLVQDAAGHGAGVQVDATVKLVLLGVKSPEVSSSSGGCVPNASSPTVVGGGEGLNKYQSAGADALQLTLRFSFRARLTASVRLRYFTLVESLLDL